MSEQYHLVDEDNQFPLIPDADLRELFLLALGECDGNVKRACEISGIDRRQYNKWLLDYPDFVEGVHIVAEELLDNAEQVLQDAINDQNLTATIFFLKCKGKKRGYIERETKKDSDQLPPVTFEMNFGVAPKSKDMGQVIEVKPKQVEG